MSRSNRSTPTRKNPPSFSQRCSPAEMVSMQSLFMDVEVFGPVATWLRTIAPTISSPLHAGLWVARCLSLFK